MDKGGKKNPKDYYKKALTLADLKPGDILTFEGEYYETHELRGDARGSLFPR